MGLLQPDLVLNSVLDIKADDLRQKGIAGLLVDIDNTLVAWEDSLMDDSFFGLGSPYEAGRLGHVYCVQCVGR